MVQETTKEQPRLSPGIAKILLQQSPLHAWQASRLLGGGQERKGNSSMLLGSVVDDLVFYGGSHVTVRQPRTKAKHRLDVTNAVFVLAAKIARPVLAKFGSLLTDGTPQLRLEWNDSHGNECSGIADYVPNSNDQGHGYFYDLKTAFDISDTAVDKAIDQLGYDIQMAAYREAIAKQLQLDLGIPREPLLIVAETRGPHDCRLVELTNDQLEAGQEKWQQAGKAWRRCMDTGVWPGMGPKLSRREEKAAAAEWVAQVK